MRLACLLALVVLSCGDDGGGGGGGGGTISGTSNGMSDGSLSGVTLACVPSASGGAGDQGVDCTFGGDPPADGVIIVLSFITDYTTAPADTVLVQGTDFTIFGVNFYADGGFGAAGIDTVEGALTITLGARDGTTPAVLDGSLDSTAGSPIDWVLTVEDVPAELP